MQTPLCGRLGIEVSIILAPMGGTTYGVELAAAVSNAGGLGQLHLWCADVGMLRSQVREMRALTDKPFAVNLNMEFPQEERLAACLEEDVPVISFFWRDPGALVKQEKAGGAVVMYTVGSAKDAEAAVRSGVNRLPMTNSPWQYASCSYPEKTSTT